jgi:transcriptional regulator NrdR family protein
VNSRSQKRTNGVWRRRTCLSCGTTFTSVEAPDLAGSVTVKSYEQLQAFQRDKLFLSVYDSLKHRKTALRDATELTDTVLHKLHPHMKDAVVFKDVITETVHVTLAHFDKAAATHYAAFHPVK